MVAWRWLWFLTDAEALVVGTFHSRELDLSSPLPPRVGLHHHQIQPCSASSHHQPPPVTTLCLADGLDVNPLCLSAIHPPVVSRAAAASAHESRDSPWFSLPGRMTSPGTISPPSCRSTGFVVPLNISGLHSLS